MPNLNAEIREKSAKTESLRKAGFIPAEIYGKGLDNIHITISAKEFEKIFAEAGENTIVNLKVENDIYPVLVHGHQINPISRKFLSADFFKVRMDEKITASIPLLFMGEAPAVKEQGGILIKSMDEVEVEALPAHLPHEIKIDLSVLKNLNESVYVRDIKVSGNYEIITDPKTVIATVSAPEEEEVRVTPVSVDDIVTEGEEKRTEKERSKEETK